MGSHHLHIINAELTYISLDVLKSNMDHKIVLLLKFWPPYSYDGIDSINSRILHTHSNGTFSLIHCSYGYCSGVI